MTAATAFFKVYSDGGARGNPGPAAVAFMIYSQTGKLLRTGSRFIGTHTNNQAEYEAIISALTALSEYSPESAICYLDSELVCRQITGIYSVKNPELRLLWEKVQELKKSFIKINFENVPRTEEHIKKVDKLVNSVLDAQFK